MLWLKGSDTSKFGREVGAAFKKLVKGSQAPDTEKVAIDRIMLNVRMVLTWPTATQTALGILE